MPSSGRCPDDLTAEHTLSSQVRETLNDEILKTDSAVPWGMGCLRTLADRPRHRQRSGPGTTRDAIASRSGCPSQGAGQPNT